MCSFLESYWVIHLISIGHILVVPSFISHADGAQGLPVLVSGVEDRNACGDNSGCTDASNTTVETRINRSDRGNTQNTGEPLGEGQLFGKRD